MLQISQIENPRCSAKIDQMRLRNATALPVDFQNFSSSGFHSEIQVEFRLLISRFLRRWGQCFAASQGMCQRYRAENSWMLKLVPSPLRVLRARRAATLCNAKSLAAPSGVTPAFCAAGGLDGGPSVRRPQPIANAGLSENVLRPLRIGLDLLAQLTHIDAQVLGVGEIIPQLAKQKFVGEHLAGMLHKHAQQLVLLGG